MKKRNVIVLISILLVTVSTYISCEKETTKPHEVTDEYYEGKVTGLSDVFIDLQESGATVEQYNPLEGTATINFSGTPPEFNTGSVITVDVDTMGYLRKVVSSQVDGNTVVLQTEQAYLNDVFVDKDFKLNTELIEPNQLLKSTSSNWEISRALTDEEGYIHPVEIIYRDAEGRVLKKSALVRSDHTNSEFKIIDFYQDFSNTDLYGEEGDNIHFYISEGNVSLTSNAVFEFDFDFTGELDENTKVKKGELRTFTFYLDSEAGFLAKLALDLSDGVSKNQTNKILNMRKITAKFMVGPVPVWISFDCDIYGRYNFNADASLHADWGFESSHTLKVGGTYSKETDNFFPIKEYEPENTIYPLNLNGEINLDARFELYPRVEVKFYDFFGPYAEIVPYVTGNYNSAMQSQITVSGSETFLAWDSGLDLGLDFRIGTELTFLWGLLNKEFGPTSYNCFENPLWKSPHNIELLTQLPSEANTNSTINLKIKVTDYIDNPSVVCPLYITGDGTFTKQIPITNNDGEVNIYWTLKETAGTNTFTASIFKADKTLIKKISHSVTGTQNYSLPSVNTSSATEIAQTSATLNGNVTSDGGYNITERGFYYSKTDNNPDSGDSKETVIGTTGSFSKNISGLDPNTQYYFRAFATNSEGTAEGNVESFTTQPSSHETGTVTDIDGNVYQTVKIGDQWWMAENLKVTNYRNGDQIDHVTDNTNWSNLTTGAYCEYDNNSSNVATYGRLYNWYAVSDSCNIAPVGWHVPSDAEWKTLEIYLGMSQSDADDIGWRDTDEGGKLKETGIAHWVSPNTGATNESGFSALPGGYRYSNGTYGGMGYYAHIWSSSESGSNYAWFRLLSYDDSLVGRGGYGKRYGFSVRCVRD